MTGGEKLCCSGVSRLCMQDRLARGGTVLLERPWVSWTWGLPSTRQLLKSCVRVKGDASVLRRMSGRPVKETTGWLTNSDEIARALQRVCPGNHGDELMDVVLSAVGLERCNQEVSLVDICALEEADNEVEPENVLEGVSDDDDAEKKTKRRRVFKRPVEQVLREKRSITDGVGHPPSTCEPGPLQHQRIGADPQAQRGHYRFSAPVLVRCVS